MAKRLKKNAMPKRIGGVKIPKPVRRGVRQFVNSQGGKAITTEVVAALGAALAAGQMKRGSAPQGRNDLSGLDLAGATASTASAVKFAIGEATRTFNEALHQGKSQADARAAWPEVEESAPPKKPVGGKAAEQPPH